jgi:TonB family protein
MKLICAALACALTLAAADARVVPMTSIPEAKIVRKVQPVYPPDAIVHHIEGVVKIKIVIGTDGHVTQAHIVGGHPLLVHSALQAVRQWVFQPMGSEDQPIRVATQVEVPFHLSATATK